MPELPEVETVCNALKNRAESRIIKEFKIYNPNLRWVINRKIPDKTANQKINLIKARETYSQEKDLTVLALEEKFADAIKNNVKSKTLLALFTSKTKIS